MFLSHSARRAQCTGSSFKAKTGHLASDGGANFSDKREGGPEREWID
jgi:hypothetical protein